MIAPSSESFKVAHLTSVHSVTDNRILHKECRSLSERGYDVTLIGPADQDGCVQKVKIVAVPRARNRLERFTVVLWKLYKKAIATDACVYHFHDPELMIVGLLLKLRGKRVVYDVHEDFPKQTLTREWIPRILRVPVAALSVVAERVASTCVDGMVAATASIAGKFPPAKTVVVRNYPRFDDALNQQSTPYFSRPNTISFTGVMSQLRGIRELVRAVDRLPAQLGATLELVGRFSPASFRDDLSLEKGWQRVAESEWMSREALAAHIGRARIGVVLYHPAPNHTRAQPQKLFEYMAAGIPVVISNFPLWREIMESVGCGFCVDPTDPDAIAEKLEWLFVHEAEASEMGSRGQRAVAERFSWAPEESRLIEFYQRFALCSP